MEKFKKAAKVKNFAATKEQPSISQINVP